MDLVDIHELVESRKLNVVRTDAKLQVSRKALSDPARLETYLFYLSHFHLPSVDEEMEVLEKGPSIDELRIIYSFTVEYVRNHYSSVHVIQHNDEIMRNLATILIYWEGGIDAKLFTIINTLLYYGSFATRLVEVINLYESATTLLQALTSLIQRINISMSRIETVLQTLREEIIEQRIVDDVLKELYIDRNYGAIMSFSLTKMISNHNHYFIHLSVRYYEVSDLHAKLSKLLHNSNKEIVNVYFGGQVATLSLLRAGFIPHPRLTVGSTKKFVNYIRLGLSKKEIAFWCRREYEKIYKQLEDIRIWSLYSKEYAVRESRLGDSYLLLNKFPEEVYSSMRPKTTMEVFRGMQSNRTYQHSIPVTRYAYGMNRGIFFDTYDETIHCGTFYYSEAESSTSLGYSSFFTSFCKSTAVVELIHKLKYNSSTEGLVEEAKILVAECISPNLARYIAGHFREDFTFTPVGYAKAFGLKTEKILGRRMYSVNGIEMYDQEDLLDQVLCKLASAANYDIVILTNMIGSHQIVTEILDTRARSESFSNLIYA